MSRPDKSTMNREILDEAEPVRLQTAPTGGESVYLFFDFTIINLHKAAGVLAFDGCLD